MGKTDFFDLAAVHAWDLWFRWREGHRLRDLTIDATWRRVADAVASAEGDDAEKWAQRYIDAFSKWQLLPNERLLREAGTEAGRHALVAPQAVLNVAAFIDTQRGGTPRFDSEEFMRISAIAVRFLDDASIAADKPGATGGVQIGLLGIADALARLGASYASDTARDHVRTIASAFAEGCLAGNLALARERGPNSAGSKRLAARLRARGVGRETLAEVHRYGVRYAQLTAIGSNPRVAMLANNATDGLDPQQQHRAPTQFVSDSAITTATTAMSARWRDPIFDADPVWLAQTAQLELRAAIQPWIDRPIDTPLLALSAPDDEIRSRCATLAAAYGLKAPRWRLPVH